MKGLIIRLLLPALLSALIPTAHHAQCTSGNCRTGNGTFVFPNGDSYDGQFLNGQPHGKGKYLYKSKQRYEGDFNKGQFEGLGTMYYPDGAYYTGNWKSSRKDGAGRLVTPDGNTTQGVWSNGKYAGNQTQGGAGTAAASNKPTTKPTGSKPSSAPGKPEISGLRNCNTVFCQRGKGYFDYPEKSRWVGEFKDGYPYGRGVCYYSNGDRYEGEFANNAPNGEGVMYFAGGRVHGAVWANGTPVKELDSHEDLPAEAVRIEASKNVKIWALVVGVGRYTAMPSLKFTDDDAFRFYSFLKSPEGGALPDDQITILVDESATRDNVLKTMRQLFLKADANDVVMLYFSGHGLEGCFLPVDYDGYNNKLRHEEIRQIFLQSKAKHKVCIADACHSGSLNYGLAAKGPAPVSMARFYQAFEDSDGGIALLMSSKAEELSLEDHGLRQGVFTYYLLNGLKGKADTNNDHIVTIREIYNFVYAKVREYTAGVQTPILTGIYDDAMPVAQRLR